MAEPEPISLDSIRQPAVGSPMVQDGGLRSPGLSSSGGVTTSPSFGGPAVKHITPGIPVGRNSPPVDASRHAYLNLPPVGVPNQPYGSEGTGYTSSTETIQSRHGEYAENGTAATRRTTTTDDITLSTQRSKRLVSGYMFGPPVNGDEENAPPIPERPTPLSTPQSSSTSIYGDPSDPEYDDRLNGLRDGEADLDETAVQAEGGGSEAYMRKEANYSFPSHRLKRKMKGE